MYCPHCSTEIPNDAKFCYKCRYDLSRLKTPPSRKASSDPLDELDTLLGEEIDASSFSKGSLFANRYEILDDGKKGGMGAVYKCKDSKLNIIVALKVIHPRLLTSKQALSRFRQEVAISLTLQHPNIVRVYNLEEWENKEYFTMEWVEGVTLRDIIIQRKKENKTFSIVESYKIISQLCDALQYAHQYTVHRDIKPENILVSDTKELKVKITDFGIAKMLSPSQFTSTSIQMGTPYYMAPEQKDDAANVDKRADIYALGVVLFELLTLQNTVGPEMPSELNPILPKETDALYRKAVASRPENRYREAQELSAALHGIMELKELSKRQEEEDKRINEEAKKQEEKNRKAEEERKKKEAEEAEKQRKEADRQRAATEEKAKIEAERKNIAAEKDRLEREKKKIEEERTQAEGQRTRQEQARREEEARQRRFQEEEAQKKKNPLLMIGIVIAVIIGIFIYTQRNKTAESPMPPEAPAPLSASAPEPTPTAASKPGPAPSPIPKPAPAPITVPAPQPKPEVEQKSSIPMVFVKGGCFQMGDTFGDGGSDEKPVHEVCLDSFYIGKYEVTVGEFRKFVDDTGYRTEAEKGDGCYGWTGSSWKKDSIYNWKNLGFGQDDRHPVACVSFHDTQEYINWLNRKGSGKYRLPTEAEWEYSARSGGKSEKYSGGNDVDSVAWYDSNSGKQTHPVGQKRSNGLGIYDMSGNVWEWVSDRYDSGYYGNSPRGNPKGPDSGTPRVLRGGSWSNFARLTRTAYRGGFDPVLRNLNSGFRLARTD